MLRTLVDVFYPKKIRVAIVVGGPSAEYDVSLRSGKMIKKFLNPRAYNADIITVSKEGKWPISFKDIKHTYDLVFIAMHGAYGEDGTLQKILSRHSIPFTGSSSVVSARAMNKPRFNTLLKKHKILTPRSVLLSKNKTNLRFIDSLNNLGLPLVIKPIDSGSSIGVSIVKKAGQLIPALKEAFVHSKQIMVEEFIEGRELTCGVLVRKGKATALIPTEIIPRKSSFFDYHAKYTPGASREITPPRDMDKNVIKKIQDVALKTFKVSGCASYARVDMILHSKNNKLYVLEINTLPGMTKTSLLPQGARAAGIDFPELLDSIISNVRR